MANKTTAVDVGGHTIKAIEVKSGKQGVAVTGFGGVAADDGASGLVSLGLNLKGVVSGLAGREMTLRYNRVPPTPDAQLQKLMDLEIQDLSEQSGGGLSADYNLLPGANEGGEGDDIVLLALAKNEALDERGALIKAAGGSVDGYVPNCIALYNAYLRCGPVDEDSLVCLANIGQDTIDIAIVKGLDLLFARNLTGGGRVLDEAIAKGFNVGNRKAESLKRDLLDLDPASRGRYASSQAEKVTVAAGGAASVVASAIQSSVAFCQSQTGVQGLALDKILLAGGSARLRGICGMLREAVRCPVDLFDAFDSCDLSGLSDAESEDLKTYRYEAVVALGLALGRQDDSLYALEILPESVRKRRRFAQQTLFNIAAGVIGVAVLGITMRDAEERQTRDALEANKVRPVARLPAGGGSQRPQADRRERDAPRGRGVFGAALSAVGRHLARPARTARHGAAGALARQALGRARRAAERESAAAGPRCQARRADPAHRRPGQGARWHRGAGGLLPVLAGLPRPPVDRGAGGRRADAPGAAFRRTAVRVRGFVPDGASRRGRRGGQLMDIQDFWDTNKRWLLGVLLGVVVFFVAKSMLSYAGPANAAAVSQWRRSLASGERFSQRTVTQARSAQDGLQLEMDRLLEAMAFEPAAEFVIDTAKSEPPDVQFNNAQQRLLHRLEDLAAEYGVDLERRNLQWTTPVTPEERRSTLLGMALMDEAMARLFEAHRRVVEADPAARGLTTIHRLRIGSGRGAGAGGPRRAQRDASQYLAEEVFSFKLDADAATAMAWLEACKGNGNPMSMLDLRMTGPQRPGEPVTLEGELAAVTFDRERFDEDLAEAELEESN